MVLGIQQAALTCSSHLAGQDITELRYYLLGPPAHVFHGSLTAGVVSVAVIEVYPQLLARVGDYLGREPPPRSFLIDSGALNVSNSSRRSLATPTGCLDSSGYANVNLLAGSTTISGDLFPPLET